MARTTLTHTANELLVIADRLDMTNAKGLITPQQIKTAAERWSRYQHRRGRCHSLRWSRERFIWVATAWLQFMGRLKICEPMPVSGEEWIEPFVTYMQAERGLSASAIHDARWHTRRFFSQLVYERRTLAEATIFDVDAFLESLGRQGWRRVSIAKSATTLRAFFRYAEDKGWCKAGIAAGIVAPHVYRDEGVPIGPDWSDVERLIGSVGSGTPNDIRDKALLHGARASEAAQLRIQDLNFASCSVSIVGKGGKQRHCPLWPLTVKTLTAVVGHRAPNELVFLNRCGAGITRFGIHTLVERYALKAKCKTPSMEGKRVSPHTIRHSTACHLLRAGVDINTIRGWLGHVSLDTTNVYAEIDLQTKADALAKCEIGVGARNDRRWHQPKVMAFLHAL